MIKTIFVRLLAALFIVGALGTLSGCNTVSGVGRDIDRFGEKIQDVASEPIRDGAPPVPD